MTKEEMKEYTCCFTGHRKIPANEFEAVKNRLNKAIVQAIMNGYRFFGAGGALGFDTLAAKEIIELKGNYPQIRLILVLPCLSQEKYWSRKEIDEYEHIKCMADKVVYTSKDYIRDCMFNRNKHLVDNSSLCICYLTRIYGGTAYTVDYAIKNKLAIVNVAYDL